MELSLSTSARIQAVDITERVAAEAAGVAGMLWVATPHTTAALILCEGDDKMLADIESTAARLLAPLEPFTHDKNDNPNAAGHLMSSLFGTQLIVPTTAGGLDVGTYQRIVFVELDGPRERRVRLHWLAREGASS
jgi:secondary thiamine-phosphate synthase enzyme